VTQIDVEETTPAKELKIKIPAEPVEMTPVYDKMDVRFA